MVKTGRKTNTKVYAYEKVEQIILGICFPSDLSARKCVAQLLNEPELMLHLTNFDIHKSRGTLFQLDRIKCEK